MLNGFRIYSSDKVWRQILADFGATVLDAPTITDINFDELEICHAVSALCLKSMILDAINGERPLQQIFGRRVSLPKLQSQIIVLLHKTKGLSSAQLKSCLGFAPDVTTHAIDTAIYQLRQKFGHDFIINTDGVYKIGKL